MLEKPWRILIIGCPGSGKTTLSLKLHSILGVPRYSLDDIYWLANWQRPDAKIFIKHLHHLLQEPEWIMDGTYLETLDTRIAHANIVVFIDRPLLGNIIRVIFRGLKRLVGNKAELPFRIRQQSHVPLSKKLPEKNFVRFLFQFNKDAKPRILQKLSKNIHSVIIIRIKSQKDMDLFIYSISHVTKD